MFEVEPVEGEIAHVRVDDEGVNAIGSEFLERFPSAWARALGAGEAIVLSGNGRVFSAGLDLAEVPELSEDELARFFRRFVDVLDAILAARVPVVAAVDGPAIAGGAVLALACDLRVACQASRFALTEVQVGVPYPEPVLALARDRLPADEHAPAILGAEAREGEAAVAHGWAHTLASGGDVVEAASEHARRLAQAHEPTYARTKQAMNEPLLDAIDGFRARAGSYARVLASETHRAGIRAAMARLSS